MACWAGFSSRVYVFEKNYAGIHTGYGYRLSVSFLICSSRCGLWGVVVSIGEDGAGYLRGGELFVLSVILF